jgi:hypothetical protein
MRKIVGLCLASLFLLSCVGIDSTMTIKDNGSGTLVLSYRISQMVTQLGESTTGSSAVPLPVSRADFDRALANAKGKVRLTKFDRSENEKDITIRAELAFDSLDALSQVDSFKDAALTTSLNGSRHTLTQTIAKAVKTAPTADTQRMMDELFDGYALTFKIQTPSAILSAPLGTLSADKKTLTYTVSAKDVIGTTSDIVLSLSW